MPGLWVLFADGTANRSAAARRLMQKECMERDWQFSERPVPQVRSAEGRPLWLMLPRDVNAIYRAIHRDSVAVLDSTRACVRLDPRHERPAVHRTMPLQRLIEYKSCYEELPLESLEKNVSGWLQGLEERLSTRTVEGELDARCLPFIAFDLGEQTGVDLQLATGEGRMRFHQRYGPPRNRRDARRLSWRLDASAYHGRDVLQVGGCMLPPGFHWDVQIERGGADVCTTHQVWQLRREQYLNVAPDMHVRSPRGRGGRRIWPEGEQQ